MLIAGKLQLESDIAISSEFMSVATNLAMPACGHPLALSLLSYETYSNSKHNGHRDGVL